MDSKITNSNYNENEYWIIDTDYSFDDQIALSYLINKINIIAITVSGANCKVKPTRIVKKIQEDLKNKFGNENIPVYAGADRPYIDYVKELKDDPIFDPYNFIQTDFSQYLNNNHENAENDNLDIGAKISNIAAVKIAEYVRLYDKKLNILTLGPLTNVSLAVLIDSNIRDKLNNLFIVGGSYNNHGNSGNCAEYNFRVDPVASKNVIAYFKHITLIPLEIENLIKLSSLKIFNNNKIPEFKEALDDLEVSDEETRSRYSFLGFIGSIVAINLNKENLVKEKHVRPCDVDIIGRFTRGGLAIEKYDYLKSGKFNEITIIEEVNTSVFYDLFKSI